MTALSKAWPTEGGGKNNKETHVSRAGGERPLVDDGVGPGRGMQSQLHSDAVATLTRATVPPPVLPLVPGLDLGLLGASTAARDSPPRRCQAPPRRCEVVSESCLGANCRRPSSTAAVCRRWPTARSACDVTTAPREGAARAHGLHSTKTKT
jgi:hypothetical protein